MIQAVPLPAGEARLVFYLNKTTDDPFILVIKFTQPRSYIKTMKKVILSLTLAAVGLLSTTACTAQANGSSSDTNARSEAQAASTEGASPVKHIDAAYMRANIWDYKGEPSKFVFKGSRPAIIDFYADWCGPCRSLGPKLEAAAKKYAGKIDVYKVNVDKESGLANIFGVKSIPMVLFIPMQGIPIQTVGDLSAEQIEETIAQIYPAKK